MPEVEGVEHRFLSAGGLRTHVAEAGSGPPLLLLHGWPQHWWMWRELIGPLAESHRVIAPDLRGFGWTDAPAGGYDPEVFASDVVALLDALGIEEQVDLIGHDWGGWTGYMLCLRFPERIRRFMALNIYHPFARPSPRVLFGLWRFWYQWALAAPLIGPRANRFQPVLRWVGSRQASWSEQELSAYADQFKDPVRAMAGHLLYRHAVAVLPRKVLGGEYRKLTMAQPGLMLFGTQDHVQDERNLEGYEQNAPNMKLELVPGAGHFIVDQQPELVLERARELLGSSPEQRPKETTDAEL
jgi:pimeloyl-ACP methyl ester carboxylesterase